MDESMMITGLLRFDDERCERCLICTQICPARSILMDKSREDWKEGMPYLDCVAPNVTLCVACGDCLAACPTKAIAIERSFNAGGYYRRLSQDAEMTYPRKY